MTSAFTIAARMSTDAARKRFIMRAREWGMISGTRATFMLLVFGLVQA